MKGIFILYHPEALVLIALYYQIGQTSCEISIRNLSRYRIQYKLRVFKMVVPEILRHRGPTKSYPKSGSVPCKILFVLYRQLGIVTYFDFHFDKMHLEAISVSINR